MLKTEDQKRKDDIKNRKEKLKQVQADDARAKQGHRDRQSALANRVADFSEKNLLSYVYDNHEHKSYELDKKKERMIGLMKDQFQSDPRLRTHMDKTLERDHETIEKRKEKELERRMNEKKKKEMEAKMFQDQQVLAKLQLKEELQKQKIKDQEQVDKDVIKFKEEEAKRK